MTQGAAEPGGRDYPPIYPWSAFDSRRWLEAERIPVIAREPPAGAFTLHCQSEEIGHRLTSEFDQVYVDRVGVLRGEFVALENGLILVDRAGRYLTANFPTGGVSNIAPMPFELINQPMVWQYVQSVRDHWDQIPLVENGAVFSHVFWNNYYHFSFEFLQKFRMIEGFDVQHVAAPERIYEGGGARNDLISRALGARKLLPTSRPMRFKDPVIAQAHQSDHALRWLRNLVGKTVRPAGKRYYVRRSPLKPRRGNNIAEDARFLDFLRRHEFSTVDFGNGELSVHEQIDILQGASVVLAPHGAGLTNIAYLNAPATIIEVFSRSVISTSFIRISEMLGLEHHSIVAEGTDPHGDIVVDCDLLARILATSPRP